MIGVVAALEPEAGIVEAARRKLLVTDRPSAQIKIRVAGMGADNACRAATELISSGAKALVSWGTAAALQTGLQPGSLLMPTQVVLPSGNAVALDSGWHQRAFARLAALSPVAGSLLQVNRVLTGVESKTELLASTGAQAADMESFAITEVATANKLSCLVLRAVVDSADMRVPEYLPHSLGPDGRPRWPVLVRNMVCAPGDLAVLLRLGLGFRRATRALGVAATELLRDGLALDSSETDE